MPNASTVSQHQYFWQTNSKSDLDLLLLDNVSFQYLGPAKGRADLDPATDPELFYISILSANEIERPTNFEDADPVAVTALLGGWS